MKTAKLLVINGTAQSGKDSFIGYMKEYNPDLVYDHSTVETIKEAAFLLGYTGRKTPKERKFLSDLKLAWTEFNDGSFMEIVQKYEHFKNAFPNGFILAVCVREPEEIQKIKDKYPEAITVLIRRPGIKIPNNMADQRVEHFDYDFIINNDSDLNNLKNEAFKFMKELNNA